MEGDQTAAAGIVKADIISIHTLAWRVTLICGKTATTIRISIHTLAWRVTWTATSPAAAARISIHTLAWRVTA